MYVHIYSILRVPVINLTFVTLLLHIMCSLVNVVMQICMGDLRYRELCTLKHRNNVVCILLSTSLHKYNTAIAFICCMYIYLILDLIVLSNALYFFIITSHVEGAYIPNYVAVYMCLFFVLSKPNYCVCRNIWSVATEFCGCYSMPFTDEN